MLILVNIKISCIFTEVITTTTIKTTTKMTTEFTSEFKFDSSKITLDHKRNTNDLINVILMRSITDKDNDNLIEHRDEFLNMIYGWYDGVCYTKMTSLAVLCFGIHSEITKQIAVMILTAKELQK